MVKGSYKPLVRKRHGSVSNMRVILACVFGVVVLTGITGHLFSRGVVTTTPPPPSYPHHEALAKLIRTSEHAIGWIGNKTIDSINGIKNFTASAVTPDLPLIIKKNKFVNWLGNKTIDSINNIKNLTASAVTPDSRMISKKNKFINWLRGAAHYNDSEDIITTGAESSETEDSGESVVIAHRTPGHGFSWGPPKDVTSEEESPGPLHVAGARIHSVLSYLYQTSRNISRRGKHALLAAIDTARATKETLKTKLFKTNEKNEETADGAEPPASAADGPCDEVTDHVCAVDWDRNVYTIFRNGCWARVYNQRHGTNFSIHDNDVCINLFAHQPENYQKIDNPDM